MYQSMNQFIINQRAFILICSFLALLITMPTSALAQNNTACDPEIMDAMEARAWMEAQREITQNKNLIYKPDSVLEYTCFNKMLIHFAANGNNFFSEEGNPAALDSAFASTVGNQMVSYLEQNYQHKYLANRSQHDYNDAAQPFNDYAYVCGQMNAVWSDSYLSTFANKKLRDGFYDFAYYQQTPILNASDFMGSKSSTASTREAFMDAYTTNINEAYSETSSAAYRIQKGVGGTSESMASYHILPLANEKITNMYDDTGYVQDPLETHLDKILPVASGSGTCPGAAIPTGVQIKTAAGVENEYVCPNPGCAVVYSGSSATCKPTPAPTPAE